MSDTSTEKLLTGGLDEESILFQKLLLDSKSEQSQEPESNFVAPKPGWCLKTWTLDNEKVFVNICTSDLVLKPQDLSEEEVRKIVESEDPTKFRIPMGIGEAHKELDLSGKEADTYDIVIHPSFCEKCKKISFFKEFFIMLIFEGLESKYELKFNREYKILKNRKVMGTLQMQSVRTKSKPVIMEMDPYMYEMEKDLLEQQKTDAPIMSEISSKKTSSSNDVTSYETPTFSMLFEPETGYPEFLVFEIDLPNQETAHELLLDISEDCLLLHAPQGNYKLDIDLPYNVDSEQTGAQFHRKNKTLTVTMAVLKKT